MMTPENKQNEILKTDNVCRGIILYCQKMSGLY
nr:hypothetical protein [Salmonella sp.]